MQLTSSPRRALGLLAVGTVGMSTALVGIAGVAQAAPPAVPQAPVLDSVYGQDESLSVFFDAAEPDEDFAEADEWQYQLDGGAWVDVTSVDWSSGYGQFDIENLTNKQTYAVKVRGVDTDEIDPGVDSPGTASEERPGTPYVPIGAPGTPAVTVTNGTLSISWTAPTEQGSYDLFGYEVGAYVDAGEGGGHTDLCETDAATLTCSAKVVPGFKYTVLVTAFDEEGNYGDESGAAAQVTVPALTVPSAVPTKSGDLALPAGASSTVAAGKTITVTGTGYAPGSTVTLAIYSTPTVLTTVIADGNGAFTATVTVPAGLAAGTHTLVAAGVDSLGNARYVNLAVTVTAGGGVRLANTGADVTVPALGGIAVLGLGAGLIVVARRRTNA